MRVAFYTNSVSPHQLPLYERVAEKCDFRYISINLDWRGKKIDTSCKVLLSESYEAKDWLEKCDVLILDRRDLGLIERRCRKGLKTFFGSERWLKPIIVAGVSCSGRIRTLVPSYRKMAKRFVELTKKYECFKVLPYGVWAERDFEWLGVPKEKMDVWGYFVAPSASEKLKVEGQRSDGGIKVLWAGRAQVEWKRLKDVERAVELINSRVEGKEGRKIVLDVVANVSLEKVREEMRKHDVFVMASNAYEGWGAVVNEALEEGMAVIGTYEAGSSATILPREVLYHSGDVKALANLLRRLDVEKWRKVEGDLYRANWTAENGAKRMLALINPEKCPSVVVNTLDFCPRDMR